MTNLFSSDLSFSGLPCTIKLLRSKHTEISMWLARPFISIFCRSACGIKRWLNSLQSLMNLESWSLNFILIYFLPSTPCSSKPSPFVRFPHQNPVRISPLPDWCNMPRQYYPHSFDNSNNWWGGKAYTIKVLIMQSSLASCNFPHLRPNKKKQLTRTK